MKHGVSGVRDCLPGSCLRHVMLERRGVLFHLDHRAPKLTARVEDSAGLEESLSRWDGKAPSRQVGFLFTAGGGWPHVHT